EWTVYIGVDKILKLRRQFDMYVFPDGYAFVLPHNPYGWGYLLGLSLGIGYIVGGFFHVPRLPRHISVSPISSLYENRTPYQVLPAGVDPLGISNAPVSDEYAGELDPFRLAAFAIRPLGIKPDGTAVVGYVSCEQEFPLGKLGREVFLSPVFVGVFDMLFKLADISAFLTHQTFGRYYMGLHKEYNTLARIDYALTMFHTLLLADFPAYRVWIEAMYSLGHKPDNAPLPSHSMVLKTTGNQDQLIDAMSALPLYVGMAMFPDVVDYLRVSKYYKNF
ncbi:MAG: hypothetical protein GXO39_05400, partial [Thermotogae bacterium]|nr:hypothetical protein [Thermotogota bacterium]